MNPALWSQFAAQFAITPGSDGNIGTVELDKLRPEFAKAMPQILPESIYGPVTTADGVYFIKVLEYTPPRKAVFKDHIEEIRKKTEEEIFQKTSAAYSARLRKNAVIEYFFQVPQGAAKK